MHRQLVTEVTSVDLANKKDILTEVINAIANMDSIDANEECGDVNFAHKTIVSICATANELNELRHCLDHFPVESQA